MIIWGSKVREVVESESTYQCPECQMETGYLLKSIGKFFTLYFIPLFKTKELERYVECKSCKNKFKEEVLNYEPRGAITSAFSDDEERLFSSASELVKMQMMAASLLCEDQLSQMRTEQEKSYLAFELGVIEYFDQTLLNISENENSDVKFFNFLIYCAEKNHDENAEGTFQLWRSLVVHGLLYRERKLGFDSVRNQVNPDGTKNESHFPGVYLQNAIRIDV